MTDLILALAHHFLVFGLAALLAAEAAMLRPGLTASQLSRLAFIDNLYGVFAGLILIVGFGRVFYGVHGSQLFLSNPWFWAKIVAFFIVGILSAPPTVRLIVWRRRAKADSSFVLTQDDVRWVRWFIIPEIVVFACIPLLAAAMVRVPLM